MKRPSFQFYPGDWLRATDLRSCSVGARGLWIEMICLMHEGSPYGYLKVNQKVIHATNLARIVGATLHEVEGWLQELEASGVCSRDDDGCYLSRRMIRDENLRQVRAAAGKLGGNPKLKKPENPRSEVSNCLTTKVKQNQTPSSSSSSSSSSSEDQKPSPSDLSATDADNTAPSKVSELIPYQQVVDAYNAACGEVFPNVSKLTDKRKRAIRARWLADTSNEDERKRTNSPDYWRRYFEHCATGIEFFRKAAAGEHRGEHAGWTPGFDYLMREDTWLGVRERRLK